MCNPWGGGGGGGGVCTGLLCWGLLIEITHASIQRDHLKFGSNAVGAGKAVTVYGYSGIDIQYSVAGFHTGFFEKGGKPSDTPHLPGNSAYY